MAGRIARAALLLVLLLPVSGGAQAPAVPPTDDASAVPGAAPATLSDPPLTPEQPAAGSAARPPSGGPDPSPGPAAGGAAPAAAVGAPTITPPDDDEKGFLARRIESFVPGLSIEGLSGAVSTSPHADRIVLSDAAGPYLEARDVDIGVSLRALFSRTVRIERLSAASILVARLPVAAEPAPPAEPRGSLLPSLPSLPVDVAVDALRIGRLEVAEPVAGIPVVLSVEASGRLSGEGVTLDLRGRRLDAPGSLDLDLALRPGNQVKLNLDYDEPAGGLVGALLRLPSGPGQVRVALDGPATGAALQLSAGFGDGLTARADGTLALPATGGVALRASGEARAPALLPAPLTGGAFAVDLAPEGDGLRLNALTVDAEPGRIELSGLVADVLDLRLSARLGESAPLGPLLPAGIGWRALELDGTVMGTRVAPVVDARATVRGPRVPDAPPGLVGDAVTAELRAGLDRVERLELHGAGIDLSATGAYRGLLDLRVGGRMGDATVLGGLLPAGVGWGALELDGTVSGTAAAPTIDARLAVRDPRLPGAPREKLGDALTLDVRTDAARIERLELRGAPIELSAFGTYRDSLALTVRGRLGDASAFGTLLPPTVGWGALELDGTVSGTLADPVVDALATLRGPRLPAPAPSLLGEAPTLSLRANLRDVERLELRGAAVRADARGRYAEPLDLSAQLSLANADALGQPVRGRLDADLRLSGPTANPAVRATVTSPILEVQGRKLEAARLDAALAQVSPPSGTATLRGRLDGQPLTLDAASALNGTTLRIETLAAALGPLTLRGGGTLDTASMVLDGQLLAEARTLAPLSGLAGTPLAGGFRFEVRGNPGPDGIQRLRADLRLNDLSAAGTRAVGTVHAEGSLAALDVNAQLAAADVRFTTRARLDVLGPERRVDLAALDVARGQLGARLAAPAAVVLAADGGVRVPGLTLNTRPGGSVRLGGTWGPERADLRAVVANLPAAIVNAFAPEPRLSGTASGEVRVTGTTGKPAVDGDLRATDLRADVPWARGIPPATLRVTARTRGESLEARAELAAGTAVRATLDARLPQGPGAAASLQAALRGDADVAALAGPLLAAGASRVEGRLTVDARADGTVAAPRFSGGAALSSGRYRDLEYGVAVRDIAARLRLDGQRVILESLSARGGDGTLTATGEASPLADGQTMRLTATARDFRPVAGDLFTGTFDADLDLGGGLGTGMRLGGRVVSKNARVGIAAGLPRGVADLEVREVGRGAPAAPRRTAAATTAVSAPLALDLVLDVPSRFYVQGRGLDAEMSGRVQVRGTATTPDVVGALEMRRGTLTLLDRRLNFARGTLTFNGGRGVTPDLDFLATSNVQSTTISVVVTGTPAAPKIAFSSSPELPQDEVLARLLFQRSTDKLSPFQVAQLAQVLAGATGLIEDDGKGGLLGRVARSLGLDRLGVGSGAGGATGVEAGGYLGRGIYLNVDPGATTGEPRVGVQIELTPRLKLESSAGTDGQSAGLSYEYEY